MAVNCSLTRLNISWMHVLLPTKVVDIFRPFGGMSQIDDLIQGNIPKPWPRRGARAALRSHTARSRSSSKTLESSVLPNAVPFPAAVCCPDGCPHHCRCGGDRGWG
eukprot:gene28181-biopygen58490